MYAADYSMHVNFKIAKSSGIMYLYTFVYVGSLMIHGGHKCSYFYF